MTALEAGLNENEPNKNTFLLCGVSWTMILIVMPLLALITIDKIILFSLVLFGAGVMTGMTAIATYPLLKK